MLNIVNRIISVLVGSDDLYIMTLSSLKDTITEYVNIGYNGWYTVIAEPRILITVIFYVLCFWGAVYFLLIVPFRLIKLFLPQSIKKRG